MIDNSKNQNEVAVSAKRKEKLQKQLKECRKYDERNAHLALAQIEFDLDDSVKGTYEKMQTAAEKVSGAEEDLRCKPMEQNFSLSIQSKAESSVTVKFWSEKKIDLHITDIKFFCNGQAMPKDIIQYVTVLLNKNYCYHTFDCPGQKISKCTSLNFIIKDVTSKTQHALQLPLNGGLPVFTEMLFEGR